MKHCRLKLTSPSTSSHQQSTVQQRRTPRFKKKHFRSTLHGLFTSPSCTRTKPHFQQESIKKLFLVETPRKRRQARPCHMSTKSRRKLLPYSHKAPAIVSPKRTAYSIPVASPRRSLTGQAPILPSPDDSTLELMQIDLAAPLTLSREAGQEVDHLDVAKRTSIHPHDSKSESSQRLNRLVDLRREAYRDLALSTQSYNDALVLRMRHLESLSWEDQRSWVQSLGDSNSFGYMVGADFCNWDRELGNEGNVIVMGDDDADVDVLIDLMDGDAGNVKDYEELLEFERGVMKHDVDEANWIGDLW